MSEWGRWVEHDGKHLPPDGAICQATFDDAKTLTGIVRHTDQTHLDAFLWQGDELTSHVIRYRVRKPRGLAILESLLTDMPEKVDE